jgi:predicted double-glycine peptidase
MNNKENMCISVYGIFTKILIILLVLNFSYPVLSNTIIPENTNFYTSIPVTSWKSLKFQGIVKQQKDYSCGAASLATLVNRQYGMNYTEENILDKLGDKKEYSFSDLKRIAKQLGFRAIGLAGNKEALQKLNIPVIVHIKLDRLPDSPGHFSVLKGISSNSVALADPSWGNQNLLLDRFLKMWFVRETKDKLSGRFLVILDKDLKKTKTSFFKKPDNLLERLDRLLKLQMLKILP